MVFISGQVAWQADETPVPDDLEAQAEIVMTNVVHALDWPNQTDYLTTREYFCDRVPIDT